MEYYSRISDTVLQQKLEAFGAVLIEGPKKGVKWRYLTVGFIQSTRF